MSSGKRGPHALSDSVQMSIKQQGYGVTAEVKGRGGREEALAPMTGNVPRRPLEAFPRMWKWGPQAPGLALQCKLTENQQRPGDSLPCSENSHKEKTHHFILPTGGDGKRKEEV